MKAKILAAVSAVALLSGCAMNPQQFNAAREATKAQFYACNAAINSKPEYALLRPHNFVGPPPASALADATLPTAEEARLIVQRWDERAICREQYVAAIGKPPFNQPAAAQIMAAEFAALTDNAAQFGQGRMTWATYTREGWRITQDGGSQLATLDARLADERRQNALAAAAILGAMPINQQPQTIYVRPCTVYGQIAHVC